MEQGTPTREARLTRAQLRHVLGLSDRQLVAWESQGWLRPVGQTGEANGGPAGKANADCHPGYTFADVATLRMLSRLRQSGVSSSRIRWLQSAIRQGFLKPDESGGWSE